MFMGVMLGLARLLSLHMYAQGPCMDAFHAHAHSTPHVSCCLVGGSHVRNCPRQRQVERASNGCCLCSLFVREAIVQL
jgi:hypothetical protein